MKTREYHFNRIALVLTLAAISLTVRPSQAALLPLSAFLDQVGHQNQALLSSRTAAEGARLKSEEAELLTGPQFFANTQWGKNQQKGLFFSYDSVSSDTYSLGVQQQTSFGLSAKLSYSLSRTNYEGLPAQFLLSNAVLGAPFFESSPKIELNQSLWRNGFGSETRAMENQLRAATVATQQGEILKQKFTLVEAEAAYWRLVLAREALKMSEETLLRAKKLSDWSERRAGLGLGDRSDALQGRAAVRLRQLQLQAAKDEERAARLAFNTARGTTGAGVPETLDDLANVQVSVSSDNQESFQGASGEKVPVREDLKAAEQALKIAEAASELGSARNTPTLDLFAGASLFAREAETSDAISGSFGTEQPQYGAGIKFVLPLDFSSMSHARAGYRRDIESAELALSRKRLELEQEWIDTRNKLNESLARLAVVRELEATQKEKSDYERDRLSRGRSTTYQALMFEDDYAQARLTRLRNQFEALALSVRLKSFQPLIQNADVSRNAGGKQE